ncbi:helix-turn-helix domain-containing protein [uncultured Acetobacteroides sp.]|uniref:helix-turn-helix domain-containing protein n=1 Tax=uncultured Acetobacteroides sp. TaxID=1760811 RepID=UPI0029F587B8|nr:helix-turn-helix domain-containing protein [uncultured Acetobacteroides sp.]
MRTDISFSSLDLLVFFGFSQTLIVAIFFIKNRDKHQANLYQGLLLLALALGAIEYLLNSTGYIVRVLAISNINEPLNFAIGPLLYLGLKCTIYPNSNQKGAWRHFIPTLFWLCYMTFYFIQPDECKYNSYIKGMHPNWQYLPYESNIVEDPLAIRQYCNELSMLHMLTYITLSVRLFLQKIQSENQSFFRITNRQLANKRSEMIHFAVITLTYIVTKLTFGMGTETGVYMFSYCTILMTIMTFRIINDSSYFDQQHSIIELPFSKYQKSSLSDDKKEQILGKIKEEMEGNLYFTNNLASLSGLAKQINESNHHVSQVINEQLNKSFFELLATYRIEHATMLMRGNDGAKQTIEELAEQVGYNSKSSFNTAFKKHMQLTPSEYRKQL